MLPNYLSSLSPASQVGGNSNFQTFYRMYGVPERLPTKIKYNNEVTQFPSVSLFCDWQVSELYRTKARSFLSACSHLTRNTSLKACFRFFPWPRV
jgi:hypothetical protein